MIVYDSKKWGRLFSLIINTFKESYNLRQLLRFVIIVMLYASAVTTLKLHVWEADITIDTIFFSLMGVVLSLFLVFRLNTAYDRWWEGRKLWGKLVNDSRSLSLNLNSLIPVDDKKRRKFFVANISNFAMALQWHLRDQMKTGNLIYVNRACTEDVEKAKHVPNQIASFLYGETEAMSREGVISDFDKDRLKDILQGLIDVLGGCERIKKTPIPFSHSTFIKIFTIIYIIVLPFGLINVFHYLTIPAVTIMGFAMLGIEVISEEIENPFGLEANNLPTGSISDTIRENVYEILHVKSNFQPQEKVAGAVEVLH